MDWDSCAAGRECPFDRPRNEPNEDWDSVAPLGVSKAIAGYWASGAELGYAFLWWILVGVVYSILYIRTRNLFYLIGIHSLANLLAGSTYGGFTVFGFASVIAAAWPLLRRLTPPSYVASAPA